MAEPRRKKPLRLDRKMRRDIAKEYAKMMYEEDKQRQNEEVERYRDQLLKEAFENIKERAFHVCPYCNEFQEFPGEGHREEVILGKHYWIQNCPSCGKEVWVYIFPVRFDNAGLPDYYIDSRWLTKEEATGGNQNSRIGFGIAHN